MEIETSKGIVEIRPKPGSQSCVEELFAHMQASEGAVTANGVNVVAGDELGKTGDGLEASRVLKTKQLDKLPNGEKSDKGN